MSERERNLAASDTLAAAALVGARRSAKPLKTYPTALPANLREAYAVQSQVIDQWGDEILGWKVARINPPWTGHLGSDRYVGPIFARSVSEGVSEARLPVYEELGGAFEAEVALVLSRDADPDRMAWTLADAAKLIANARLVVEAAGAPVAGLAAIGPLAAIPAFGNNNGMIVGAAFDIAELPGQTAIAEVDGEIVGKAQLWPDPYGVLPAFAFALGQAATIGRPMKMGQFVSTGALTGIHAVRLGQTCKATFGSLSTIECRAACQQPT